MKVRIVAGIALVAAIAAWLLARTPREDAEPSPQHPQETVATGPPQASSPGTSSTAPRESPVEQGDGKSAEQAVVEDSKEIFRTDTTGKLILDEQTRLNLEAFFAQTPPQEIGTAALSLVQQLPPAAAAQALDVVERYRNYQGAQDAAYTDDAPASTEDAIVQLEGLHTLRVEHFGPQLAKAFFEEEERLARELIELMRLEKDQSLTMEEKADRAQRLRDTLPSVSAADKGERPPRRE